MKTVSGILGRYSAGFTLDTYPYVTTAAQKTTEKIINILKAEIRYEPSEEGRLERRHSGGS